MPGRLQGKVVLITGSTRGIGRAIAEQCASEGARVVVTGRTADAGLEVVGAIEAAGGEAMFVQADVTDEAQVEATVARTLDRWSALDGLVCNAAALDLGALDGPITEVTLDGWEQILRADLTSVFLSAKHGMRAMLQGGRGGSVVFIASMAALRGVNGLDGYTASKGALVALARSIASYYGRYDIRCNCLAVGFVDNGSAHLRQQMDAPDFAERIAAFHLGRTGIPSDIATVAAHLLSDESGYVSGATIPVDGGATSASQLRRPSAPDIPGVARTRTTAPSC